MSKIKFVWVLGVLGDLLNNIVSKNVEGDHMHNATKITK